MIEDKQMLTKIPYSVARINAKETNPTNPKAYRIINAERTDGENFEGSYDFCDGKFGVAGYFNKMSVSELKHYINQLNNPTIDMVSY